MTHSFRTRTSCSTIACRGLSVCLPQSTARFLSQTPPTTPESGTLSISVPSKQFITRPNVCLQGFFLNVFHFLIFLFQWTSVEQLFSPPIPTNTRNRSETALQPQGSHKYDTITFSPGVQAPGSSSAHCNVEIRLGDERTPPPPTRAPPAPLTMSPCHCAVVLPEENLPVLDYTAVQTMSVEDPEIAAMSLDDMRKHAEDFECFIQVSA